ncbi:beta-glucosidase 10-like [Momordica charantia]|uniref:Beta-glucosidase 10-like n=1 Tax=Momordica charantia TaxID=3673 RepID=A0A6J1DL20_MOMCH|nr:beta-glucosidase 10-like [Momordica charantia]
MATGVDALDIQSHQIDMIGRSSFPRSFVFGAASSAYQYEGAAFKYGKGSSIWDTYTHEHPERIMDRNNGDVAVDSYHRYKEDVAILKHIGFDVYRFSIAWSRILPNGKLCGGVNRQGIDYYNNLINELLRNGIKPYITLFHWDVPQALEDEYQGFLSHQIANQNGTIGITLVSDWYVPYSNSEADEKATNRALEFSLGWFLHPLVYGDYPTSMRTLVDERLPKFTKEESILIIDSFDFLGVNYYTANYAKNNSNNVHPKPSYLNDIHATLTADHNGVPIGPKAHPSSWLAVYPKGLKELLIYIKNNYKNPIIYITENGYLDYNSHHVQDLIRDKCRVKYFHDHLYNLHEAIKAGVRVNGYFAWSLLDNFEWASGYTLRFGLTYIDFEHHSLRMPKDSARWFNNFLNN